MLRPILPTSSQARPISCPIRTGCPPIPVRSTQRRISHHKPLVSAKCSHNAQQDFRIEHSKAQRWAVSAVAIPAALVLLCLPQAANAADIQGTFTTKCAGCHLNGGNVLAAGASLFPEDMQRNGFADPEAMFNLIYKGKGRMPGYGEGCAPKGQCTFGPRLSDDDIRGLVAYVNERAAAGWK
ncbi:hypothetical protein DUNSADRAFT_9812 [Dunaliella salina]|uniref:Cytochrome c-553 n=1 Tax=Dunaliella salina TaxID=3046 RepID=A0ABQ7GGN5_DUNSA|nr:hypothetical protein DUNSADRAFT_9812 [Dunaliella salina]|eukprot:KAF5833745.1 hypothetical protein DUNSADRAFT_9812 [Dunaliella salina]